MPDPNRAIDAFRSLGTPGELRDLAARGYAPARRPRTNAHVHLPPNFSAFGSVAHAIELAAEQGVRVLGAANYYDHAVYGDLLELALERGIFPLFGLEIVCMIPELRDAGARVNDPGNPGKTYLCGKGIMRFADPPPEAARRLAAIRTRDGSRVAAMIAATEQIFAARGLPTGLDADAVVDRVVRRHGCPPSSVCLQERHVAQAFQEAAFARLPAARRSSWLAEVLGRPTRARDAEDAAALQDDLRACLMKAGRPAFVPEAFVSFAEACDLILELGGVPCYPVLADGHAPLSPFEDPCDRLVQNLRERNLHAAELIPVRNEPAVLARYVRALRSAGLIVTAGTEHNTLDLIPIEPTCRGGIALPDDLQATFWEGACVIAGHQFLTAHGELGYVDRAGRPNPGFSDAASRIASFAALGGAVIRRYFENAPRNAERDQDA